MSREREVVVRASLGAGRWDLIRQFLTENVLLSMCGGLFGLVIGYSLMNAMKLMLPPFTFPREVNASMDGRVLLFALIVSIATGILFGMAPALQATKPDLAASMKEEGRGSSGGVGRRRLRDSLIVAEIALAFMLLVVSGLMMRSFVGLLNIDAGFDSTNVLTMRLPVTIEQFPDPEQMNRYLREVRTAVEAVPGVRETAYSCARTDAGHVLRHADAGGKQATRRSREAGRWLLQGRQPVLLLHARHQADQRAAARRYGHEQFAACAGAERAHWPSASSPTRIRSANAS